MTRHIFDRQTTTSVVKRFIRFHHYDVCHNAWQTASYTEELLPVFSDLNSYILLDAYGNCEGLYSRLESLLSMDNVEFDSITMRASSIFSILTTHGVLRSDGVLFFRWIPKSIKSRIFGRKIKDIHGSDWMLSCLVHEGNKALIVDISIDSCVEISLDINFEYCYVNGKTCYLIGSDGIWRHYLGQAGSFTLVHEFQNGSRHVEICGRSNNYMVVTNGEETVIFAGGDAVPLDIRVHRCYTFPKCMVLATDRSVFFSSMSSNSNVSSCITEWLNEQDRHSLRIQTLIDPLLTIMAGKKEHVKELAGQICAYRSSSLQEDDVNFLLRNEPEYFIERMSKNDNKAF